MHLYKKCNTFVYDRACKVLPESTRRGTLPQLKHWAVDKFHAPGHNVKCKCSPLNVPLLHRRLRHVNTSICEQVFSWFRGYARTMNEMRQMRHRFLVLYYVKRHNELTVSGSASYLNPFSTTRRQQQAVRGYVCNAKKVIKLKTMKAKNLKLRALKVRTMKKR
jgi:hypothetical protein